MNISGAQPSIWKRLTRIKSSEKIGSSYLFSGPPGCGKEWVAIEFSKLINCETGGTSICNSCPSCKKFSTLQHENLNLVFPLPSISSSKGLDDPIKSIGKEDYESVLQMIDLKSKDPFVKIKLPNARRIIINSIRFLRKILYLKSQNNGRKIVIIFDAHLMSEGAGESANALLKILEEPPGNTTLILVSDKKSKLPLTIISRCQQIDFTSLAFDKVRELVENDQVSNDRATQLAMLSNGNMHLAKEFVLSDFDNKSIFVPKGFAHGYLSMSDNTIVNYKVDNYYNPKYEAGISYDDKYLDIDWGFNLDKIILSKKDMEINQYIW